jgi:hypothetical protein
MRATETLQLSVAVLPNNAADKSVTWSSSSNAIATVSTSGLVTAHSIGDVVITARSNSKNSVSDTYEIYVFVDHSATWPAQQIATFLGEEITTVIPSAVSSSGYYYYDFNDPDGWYADMFYIEIDSNSASSEDAYVTVLENAGYSISDLNYDSWGYEAIDSYFTVEVDVLYDTVEKVLTITIYRYEDLYGEAPGISETWPTDAIAEYLGSEALGNLVPAFESDSHFVYYVTGEEDYLYLVIYTAYDSIDGEDEYVAALESAGWVVDDTYYDEIGYIANDPDEQIVVTFYWWEGEMLWVITPFEEEVDPEPADGTAYFDFSTRDQRQSFSAQEQVWISDDGVITMKDNKNTGTVDVADYVKPLRIYASHRVTFTIQSGYVFNSIVITANSAAYANVTGSAAITGGTASVAGSVVTITANANATSISIVPTAQTRWDEIVVYYSEV